jgi:hypothetical protein
MRNDADCVAACSEDGVGHNAHQSNVAATEDETDAAPCHLVRELFRGARILRPSAYARAAENADAGRNVHRV